VDEFPRRGRHLGSPSLLRGFSGRRRRLRRHHLHGGVVFIDPSRPGALPVSPWSWMACAGRVAMRLVHVVGSKGVAKPSWRWPKLCRQLRFFAWVLILAVCRGQRQLALLSNCQFGVGLRRRMALATTTSWEDLVRSGLWRVALHRSATPVWYIIERWRGRQLGLLA